MAVISVIADTDDGATSLVEINTNFANLNEVAENQTISPATNSDGYIPQWNGINSKTLKNGVSLASVTPPVKATGAGFSFDSIVTQIGSTRTNVANLTTLPSVVALGAGQARTYEVRLVQDD
jgi:hypothetical protein